MPAWETLFGNIMILFVPSNKRLVLFVPSNKRLVLFVPSNKWLVLFVPSNKWLVLFVPSYKWLVLFVPSYKRLPVVSRSQSRSHGRAIMNIHAMATEGQGLLMSDSTFTATTGPYTASNNYKYNSTNSISRIKRETRCRPSKGRRCIPDVVLKNEG